MTFFGIDITLFMQGWGWVLFALLSAFFSSGMYLVNQYLKQQGYLLVFWMRVVVIVAMWPFMKTLPLSEDPVFYLTVIVTSFAASFADLRTFNASARFGGGVASRVYPATVWCAFFMWFMFDPQLLSRYAQNPVNTAGVLAALGGCVYFAMRINRCTVTRQALLYMSPALFCYALTVVLNKFAMSRGALDSVVYSYMYFQSFFSIVIVGCYAIWRQKTDPQVGGWGKREMLAAALIAGFTWICGMIYKNYAMSFTPNPSYVAALGLTVPVFIAAFYRITGHREEADVKSGMGIVASAALLALMAVK